MSLLWGVRDGAQGRKKRCLDAQCIFISNPVCLLVKADPANIFFSQLIFTVCSRDVMKDKHRQNKLNRLCGDS